MHIVMPRTFDEAIVKLNQRRLLSEFATVRTWERTAIVAMMVDNSNKGRPALYGPHREKYTILEFARLRIYCLKSPNTIAGCLARWDSLGLPRPAPGDTVEIPVHDPGHVKSAFGSGRQK